MKKLVLAATAVLLSNTPVFANPTVSGDTISWPDDGWYQVQTADTFISLCEGGQSCQVEPGEYIVINHSTGERFANIVVSGESTTAPTVSGNTISWTDNGWYQVQRSDNFVSVCEGGSSCVVEPGNYIVINHTTGERFTDIIVESDDSVDKITVDGNTIRWPNDGWYQVQSIGDYVSICNGGSSCEVEPGTYVVINHDKQTRTEVEVTDDTDDPVTDLITVENYESVVAQVLNVYSGKDYSDELFAEPSVYREATGYTGEITPDLLGDFDCEQGGTATVSLLDSSRGDGLGYLFDDCAIGPVTHNGKLNNFVFVLDQLEAENYRAGTPARFIELDGDMTRAPGIWLAENLNFTVKFATKFPNNVRLSIKDGTFSWLRALSGSGSFINNYFGGFQYQSENLLDNNAVIAKVEDLEVTLSPTQASELRDNPDAFQSVYPIAGTLEIETTDGSRILLNAATGDPATVAVSIGNTNSSTELIVDWSIWDEALRTDVVGMLR